MFFNFFGRFPEEPKWKLTPIKYDKENPNNFGGKVLLPQTVLEDLVHSQLQPPYIFEISCFNQAYKTHCGVLEFTAELDTIVVPAWMYEQLNMEEAGEVDLAYKQIPQGTFVKLLPHTTRFLEIENPKFELEQCLVNYQILSLGDEILCNFEETPPIRFTVVFIEPSDSDAVYIVDTDLSVEFCEPIGYRDQIESERTVKKYLEYLKTNHPIRPIRMKKLGLCFDFKEDDKKS